MGLDKTFLYRRLHSLLGVIPVGFFLLEHLYTNYSAVHSADKFIENVEWLWGMPFLPVLEFVFIFLPLLYHAGYGIYIASVAKHNLGNFGTFRNTMFVLQRITGVVTLVFILWHVWETRMQKMIYDYTATELASHTSTILQSDLMFLVYLIGIVSTVFHFSNGMWSFLVSWGVTVGPRSQAISTWCLLGLFVALSYIGISALIAFAQPGFMS